MYALVAIVRDEADRIGGFLDSAMRHCGAATVVDTGSVDATMEILRARAEADPRISVSERPFDDFGAARSDAFAKARGTGSWVLALDCDMTVTVDDGFDPNVCKNCGSSRCDALRSITRGRPPEFGSCCRDCMHPDAWMIRMGNGGDFEYRLPLLLRGDLPWQSTGCVHEYTNLPDRAYTSMPTDRVRVTYPDRSSPAKSAWHASLLEADLAAHPDNARTVFYLANSYRDLGRLDEARSLYRQRAAMGGFAEEAFYSAYRAAILDPWPERAASLMAAWEMRPARLEPLHVLLRDLNAHGLHSAAYRLSEVNLEPSGDTLFVHREAWTWGIKFERSIAMHWVGDRGEAYRLMDELLADPNLPPHIREATQRNRNL